MSGEFLRTGGPAGLRASHADRDRVVDVLTAAAGDGRLTAEELEERVEAALTARTVDELTVLTADLPDPAGAATVTKDFARIEQVGASTRRGEGWAVPRSMEIRSEWGEVTLDFTRAVITHDTLSVDVDMRGGVLRLVTRPGVVVDTDGLVAHYSRIKARRSAAGDGPVALRVEMAGEISFGQVVVRPGRRAFGRRSSRG
ncbi:DUF1707 domain-containing protein [Streptomyces sp. NPDC052701]|uniref:DUF1707 SHOCT-like domain-containing protein n=1 Tax=Streptomyces sp. NPDC052701 TaxID=3155533 RepID=UPI003429EDEC